jgi:hypothetical protein
LGKRSAQNLNLLSLLYLLATCSLLYLLATCSLEAIASYM